MAKTPGYEERSEKLRKQVEESREKQFSDARSAITKAATSAVSTIVDLMGNRDKHVSLAASKHILKLCGFETENVNLTGNLAATITISPEHAEKVRRVAKS